MKTFGFAAMVLLAAGLAGVELSLLIPPKGSPGSWLSLSTEVVLAIYFLIRLTEQNK